MNRFFASVLLSLLLVALVLAAVLAVTLGFVGIGWVVNRIFDMGLLESTAIAVAIGFGFAYVVYRIFSVSVFEPEEDWEDEEWEEWDEEEEEEEPPIVPWRRHRPTPAEPEETRQRGRKRGKKR